MTDARVQSPLQSELDDSLQARVARAWGTLSPAQRRVADYFATADPGAAVLTASELAQRLGVSDATIVRTAQRLGFDGLPELRRALVEIGTEPTLVERLHHTLERVETPSHLALVIQGLLTSVDVLLQQVSPERFGRAVDLLAGAERMAWSGIGPSAPLATYASLIAQRLGRRSAALTAAGLPAADELLTVESDCAVVVFAYGQVHPHVAALVERAHEVHAPVVLVTDTLQDVLGGRVAETLACWRGAPGLFASHAPTMALVEALLIGVAARDPARAEHALEELASLRTVVS
jgi:DNA-binding MurR/RpiR family transcriptional regulator